MVILQGGPGGTTLIMEEGWKNHPFRNDRDIVLMNQREQVRLKQITQILVMPRSLFYDKILTKKAKLRH